MGGQCGAAPLVDGRWCFAHDPEHADEVAAARRAGGLRRRREGTVSLAFALESLDSTAGIRRLLDVIAADGLALGSGVAQLRILLAVVGQATKLLEVGELEARVARLEARRHASHYRGPVPIDGSLLDDGQ